MKTIKWIFVYLLVIMFIPAKAIEHKETSKQEYNIPKSATKSQIYLRNIFGSVKVTTYNGDKLLLEIDKTVSAKSKTDVDFCATIFTRLKISRTFGLFPT